jgi:ATP-dependent helicase/nuclease subunit A
MSETFVDRRARALASDPTLNVALEASAGTGKTRVLVERYVRLVEEGTSPRHILAITFTRRAAGEMKTRIVQELRRRSYLWKEIRERLFEIHVTTIDAFCLGLLREFPLEAGLDPDLRLLDEVESKRLLEEAIDHALAEARRGRTTDIRFLVARFGEGALRRGLRNFLETRLVRSELLSRYVERVIPKGVSLGKSLKRLSKTLRSALRGEEGVESFLATGPDEAPPAFSAFAFALRRAADPRKATAADIEEVASYFLTRNHEPRQKIGPHVTKSHFATTSDYESHRDRVLGLAPVVARAYRQWMREKDFYAISRVLKLYHFGSERFQKLKRVRAGLDFTDILVRAVDLLEKRGEFAQSRFRLEARYHHLLIDEFQDTNDVQWRLVEALIGSWGEGSGLAQDAILAEQAHGRGEGRIREPSLFIVGDRKQSIYGFRDARVEVMEKASRQLLRIRHGGGQRLTLRHSFRASGKLLSFLNSMFAGLPKVRGDLEWSFQYRDNDHFPTTEEKKSSSPVALAVGRELSDIANQVADEVVRILEEEGRRPRDIAILFRSRASYRAYELALSDRGVPAYVYRGLGFFDSAEIRDLKALVRFLAEPASELRASELARSRLVGVSDDALFRLSQQRRSSSSSSPISRWLAKGLVDQGLPLTETDRAAIARASRLVPQWLEKVDRLPTAELLDEILDEAGYAAWFVSEDQSWENLKKALELVRRAENRGYLTMSRLGDFLESASSQEESPAVLEAVDAVNLMTVHASKGLEFDTVFVVNLHQSTRRDTSLPRIRELADGRIEVTARAASPEASIQHEPSRSEEEEKRLLYVALTRARRRLVLSTVLSNGSISEQQTLFRLLPESLRDAFVTALDAEGDETEWEGHRLRILRSLEPREYHEERVAPSYRRLLDPLVAPRPLVIDTRRSSVERSVEPSVMDDWLEARVPSGTVHRNLHYSFLADGHLVRGTIPLLVETPDRIVVLDDDSLSPGAAAALFPSRTVEHATSNDGGQLSLF